MIARWYYRLKKQTDLLDQRIQKLSSHASDELDRYEAEYHRELKAITRSVKNISSADFLKALEKYDLVLWGDFHSYGASQRGVLYFLRNSRKKPPSFGFEVAPSQYSKINAKLLKSILFQNHFPEANYLKLMDTLKQHGIEAFGLNQPEHVFVPLLRHLPHGSLSQRDLWSAGVLLDRLSEGTRKPIWTLYGDLHLSPNHLPKALKELQSGNKKIKVAVVHQNLDTLFWRKKNLERLGNGPICHALSHPDHFAVTTGVPWLQRQSWLDWLIAEEPDGFDPEEGDREEKIEEKMRLASHFYWEWMGLDPLPLHQVRFFHSPHASSATPFFRRKPRSDNLELNFPAISENYAMEWTGILARLYRSENPHLYWPKDVEGWNEWTVRYTYGFFISKLFNPFRERVIFQKSFNELETVRALGQGLGELLFQLCRDGQAHPKEIRNLLLKNPSPSKTLLAICDKWFAN